MAWEMVRKIWDWAELGYKEKQSSALLAEQNGDGRLSRGTRCGRNSDVVHRHHWVG